MTTILGYIFNQCDALDYVYCTLGSSGAAELSEYDMAFTDLRYPEYAVIQRTSEDGSVALEIKEYMGSGGDVVVPGEMGGYRVSKIGSAFRRNNELTSIVIPEGVTQLSNQVFQNCSNLVSVSLPEGLTEIPLAAFCGCTGLCEVNIPSTVTLVDYQAFMECSSLKTIRIPEGALEIGRYAFDDCSGLESVSLPAGLTTIGDSAFEGCVMLKDITFPAELKTIGDRVFYNCNVLTGIDLPAGLTAIGEYAFYNCKRLTYMEIPDGVEEIGSNTFYNCAALETLTLGKGIRKIGEYAFMYCSGVQELTVPEGVESIGHGAFYGWKTIKQLVLPDTLSTLEEFAFYGCTALEEITLSKALTVIPRYCFYDCGSLTEIVIPSGVTELCTRAFGMCGKLNSITIPSTVTVIAQDALIIGKEEMVIYGAPDSAAESYAQENGIRFAEIGEEAPALSPFEYTIGTEGIVITGWSENEAELVIPETIKDLPVIEIGQQAFENRTALETVILPDTVTVVGNYAFFGCTNLRSVTLNEGLLQISQEAFAETALEETVLPSSLRSIADDAFWGCESISLSAQKDTYAYEWCVARGYIEIEEEIAGEFQYSIEDGAAVLTAYTGTQSLVVIPETLGGYPVAKIGADAFLNCQSVTQITIPEGVVSIGNYAFCGTGLTDIKIPDSVVSIGGFVFCRCYSLQSVELSQNLQTIGEYAFSWCRALEQAVLPDSLTDLGGYVFMGCSALNKVNIPESISSMGDGVFCYCSALESISYPKTVREIPAWTFAYCSALSEFEFCGTVDTIGEKAFTGSTSLAKIKLPAGLGTIGDTAFAGCSALTEVTIPWSVDTIADTAFDDCHERLVIYGSNGSAAQEYAQNKGLPFNRPYGSYDNGVFVYTVSGDEAVIVDYLSSEAHAAIPYSIDGYIVRAVSDNAFQGCDWITDVEIPSTMTSIGAYAFSRCSSLKTVIIHSAAVSVGSYAFSSCPALEKVTVLDGMTSVGAGAFSNCAALSSIDVPASVESVGQGAMLGCSDSLIVYTEFDSCAAKYADENDLTFCAEAAGLRYIVRADQAAVVGFDTVQEVVYIPGGVNGYDVTAIEEGAFFQNTSVRKLTIHGGLDRIGASAFCDCTTLIEVEIPDGVTQIGEFAFYGCTALQQIALPGTISEWGTHTFANCSSLTKVTLGSGIKQIGNAAFYGCTNLKSILLPTGLQSIGNAALRGCTQIERVVIPSGTVSIGSYAFTDCTALKWVYIPSSVVSIGDHAFLNCHKELRMYGSLVSDGHAYAADNDHIFVGSEYDEETEMLSYDISILRELMKGYMPGPLIVLNNTVAEEMEKIDGYTYFKEHPIKSIWVNGEELLVPGPNEGVAEEYETYYKEAALVTLYYLCDGHLTEAEQTLRTLENFKTAADVSSLVLDLYDAIAAGKTDSLSVGEILYNGNYNGKGGIKDDILTSQFLSFDAEALQKYITPGQAIQDQDLYKLLSGASGDILDAVILNTYRSVVLESLKDDIKELVSSGVDDRYSEIFKEVLADIEAEQAILCRCAFQVAEDIEGNINMPYAEVIISALEGTGTGEWSLENVAEAGGEFALNFLSDFWLGARAVKLGFSAGTTAAELLLGTDEIGLQMRNYAMGYVTVSNALQQLNAELDALPDYVSEQQLSELYTTYALYKRTVSSAVAIGRTMIDTIHGTPVSNLINGGTETLETWREVLSDAEEGIEHHHSRVYEWYEKNHPSALK